MWPKRNSDILSGASSLSLSYQSSSVKLLEPLGGFQRGLYQYTCGHFWWLFWNYFCLFTYLNPWWSQTLSISRGWGLTSDEIRLHFVTPHQNAKQSLHQVKRLLQQVIERLTTNDKVLNDQLTALTKNLNVYSHDPEIKQRKPLL
jgi:hypothetical protein